MTKATAPINAERRLLDYAHAAAYLSISVRRMKQLAASGDVAKVPLGSRILFDKADLDAFIVRLKRSA